MMKSEGRDRSPISSGGRDDEDLGNNRDRDRDRTRRGDRPSRFAPRSSSNNRDYGGKKAAAERRIFVSNIAYEYRWQELKDLFRTEVGEVSYVELFNDENDKPRGCGIVEFESSDSVKKAVDKMHRYDLKGRKLVVKEDHDVERDKFGRPVKMGGGGGGGGGGGVGGGGAISRDSRDMRDLRNLGRIRDDSRGNWDTPSLGASFNLMQQGGGGGGVGVGGNQNKWGNTYGLSPQFLESLWISGPLVTRVFVANLDYKVDEKKLKEVFKIAGKVLNAELSLDRDGKSRGFAVVEYEHPVEAVQAISMFHNQMLFERKLTVRMDRVDHKPELPPKLPEGLRGLGMGLGANGFPLAEVTRNLPNAALLSGGLAGSVAPVAAALSNVVNPSALGVGNSAGLPANLAGIGAGLMGSGLGGAGDLSSLGGAFSNSGLAGLGAGIGGGLGVGVGLGGSSGLGGGNAFASAMPMGNSMGNAMSSAMSNALGSNSSAFLGNAGGGGNYGNNGSASLGGGGYGNVGRDFDSLSAAMNASNRSDFNSSVVERDYRGGGQGGGNNSYSNGPSSHGMGGVPQSNSGNGNRSSDSIVVKNLPMTATWQMLRDKFNDVGEVQYAVMRGKEAAVVRFFNEHDAARAVHMMDRTRLDGRTIDVCLY